MRRSCAMPKAVTRASGREQVDLGLVRPSAKGVLIQECCASDCELLERRCSSLFGKPGERRDHGPGHPGTLSTCFLLREAWCPDVIDATPERDVGHAEGANRTFSPLLTVGKCSRLPSGLRNAVTPERRRFTASSPRQRGNWERPRLRRARLPRFDGEAPPA